MRSAATNEFELSRRHDSLLAGPEKRLLAYVAKRLPARITPDHLTAIGVFGGALSGIGCAAATLEPHFLLLAAAGLIINWFGDSLDGALARLRGAGRPLYGFYIDQVCDVASHAFLAFGLAVSPLMHSKIALFTLVADLVVLYYGQLRIRFFPVWQVSHFGWGPTETRLAIIAGFVLFLYRGQPTFILGSMSFTLFDLLGSICSIVAFIGTAVSFFGDRKLFSRFEAEARRARAGGYSPAVDVTAQVSSPEI